MANWFVYLRNMDEWMTCDFTSFSTAHVFQLYQDDGKVIMTDCAQRNLVNDWKDFRLMRDSNR